MWVGIKLLCSCIEADHSVNFLFPVSYSMIRVRCAGRVLVDKTQPQTRRGYREWTSPPLPPPLPPQAHLAMKMLPVTPRFSLFHKRKHETVLRPSSSSLQLKPGHFSVSGERDSETRWTQILGFFLFCFFFSLLLCWRDIGTSSRCYCYRVFEEVGLDGEYDDDNNNSPLMSGILTRPGAELKPDWTAFWWKHVLAAVLGHILYLKDKMLFF